MTSSIRTVNTRPRPQWHFGALVVVAIVAGLIIWAIAYLASDDAAARQTLVSAFGKAGLTLSLGAAAGGLIAQIFKRWEAQQAAAAAEQAFYRAVLEDIKSVYDQVERAKLLIAAHQSAKTYGEQMRILPEANITVHNIRRAMRPAYTDLLEVVGNSLFACSDFIKGLTAEFREHYKDISDAQKRDEATNEHLCKLLAEGKITPDKVTFASEGWDEIQKLKALKVLRKEARCEEYYIAFRWHIDFISLCVRAQLDGGDNRDLKEQLDKLNAKLDKPEVKLITKPAP